MMGETGLGIYFWGVYIWFCTGVLLIGIPAVIEIKKLWTRQGSGIKNQNRETEQMQRTQ